VSPWSILACMLINICERFTGTMLAFIISHWSVDRRWSSFRKKYLCCLQWNCPSHVQRTYTH